MLCLIAIASSSAQSTLDIKALSELGKQAGNFVEGYSEHGNAGLFQYHSLMGATTPSLLCRSNTEPIEWQSAVVPNNLKGKYVDFLWLVSLDAADKTPTFFFYINKLKRFSFSQGEARSWRIQGFRAFNFEP